jgi:hypothetical protein
MPKRPTKPMRLQGRTDAPAFASKIRSPQAPAAKVAAALMPLILAGAGLRPEAIKAKRGGRDR